MLSPAFATKQHPAKSSSSTTWARSSQPPSQVYSLQLFLDQLCPALLVFLILLNPLISPFFHLVLTTHFPAFSSCLSSFSSSSFLLFQHSLFLMHWQLTRALLAALTVTNQQVFLLSIQSVLHIVLIPQVLSTFEAFILS